MKLCDLKISSKVNPIGIDCQPYFSYHIKSDKRGVFQTRRVITVKDGADTVWREEAEDSQSAFIPCKAALKSTTRYDVTIEVTDNFGEESSVSGYFETAFCGNAEWIAKWIKNSLPVFAAQKGFAMQPPATLFRKFFAVSGDIKKARLYCTCHGIYLPKINGERISAAEFAPGHSTYEKVLLYQTYDVTEFISRGQNELSFYVGDGWYLGVKTTPRVKNYERIHALLFQLEIVYTDKKVQIVCSDGTEECSYGKVICSDLFAGERYDENIKEYNWQKVSVADYGYENLIAQKQNFVSCCEEVPVKNVIKTPQGDTVLDFGKVLCGRVKMRVHAQKGCKVVLTHTEVLDKDGNFFLNTAMPDGGVEQRDEYISDGTDKFYEPLFTYHGFRYVKVEGLDAVDGKDFVARVYTTEKENIAFFKCSDEDINKLYKNIRNSQQSNTLSIPTDCPQREKAGWTGDIAIYAKTALLNEDMYAFLEEWLLSVRADQGKNGAVPIVVPYDGGYPYTELIFGDKYGEHDTFGSCGWGDCCIAVPLSMYRVTGNKKILEDNIDVIERWCAYILKRCAIACKDKNIPYEYDRYLWNNGFHEGDWLVPSLCKNSDNYLPQQEFTAQYAAPLYGYKAFRSTAEIFKVLGDNKKAEYYEDIADRMKTAIQNVLFDENGDMPTDLMGAYVLALAFGVTPEKFIQRSVEKICKKIEDNGGCLDTGFLSTKYLPDVLVKAEKSELAYSLLLNKKCPSWLYEVEKGATSVWESWECFNEDGNPKQVSFNHYAFGCVDEWISENLCGIKATEAGFKSFEVSPVLDKRFTFAERRFISVYGEIAVKWVVADGVFKISVKVPCNTSADIVMPSGRRYGALSGEYEFSEDIGNDR